ncbi:BTAD domain-containing putative transcriptional regulator [Micromonosporaceae bacterium Da 78-11]
MDLGGERQRKLLAILLVNANHTVPVERIVDQLWSDPPATARRQVYNSAAALRRRLVRAGFPGTTVLSDAGGYRVQIGDVALDVTAVRRTIKEADRAIADGRHDDAIRLLRCAVDRWRGNTLDGLSTPLLDGAAARLDEQRVAVVEKLCKVRLAAGEGSALVGDLREYLFQYPLRESLRGTMMLALYRCDRQAEALAVFDEGRRRLAEDLGLDPGPELCRIHAAVLRGADRPAPTPTAIRSVAAAPQASCTDYLPTPLADFTGRRAEVDHVLAMLDRDAELGVPSLVAVHGMGGVGKTAFAVHLAHRLTSRYPDGQYFVDLHGFNAWRRPMTPTEALECLQPQVGLTPSMGSPDLGAEAARLRAALAGRRVLIVLDNAADSTFIQEILLGTPGTLVLVTSRRQLVTLPGGHTVSLHPFSPHDALALFESACGPNRALEEPEVSREVVQLCGYLPLAVRAAAARLRHRPLWNVADLAEQLHRPSARLRLLGPQERSISETLAVSYGRLPSSHQRLFRALSQHTGHYLSALACATLANISMAAAEQGLETLADWSLVRPYNRNRYQLHPLLRDLALELTEHEAGGGDSALRAAS